MSSEFVSEWLELNKGISKEDAERAIAAIKANGCPEIAEEIAAALSIGDSQQEPETEKPSKKSKKKSEDTEV